MWFLEWKWRQQSICKLTRSTVLVRSIESEWKGLWVELIECSSCVSFHWVRISHVVEKCHVCQHFLSIRPANLYWALSFLHDDPNSSLYSFEGDSFVRYSAFTVGHSRFRFMLERWSRTVLWNRISLIFLEVNQMVQGIYQTISPFLCFNEILLYRVWINWLPSANP